MSEYREIRVRPVVRYIVTDYRSEVTADGKSTSSSEGCGEFPSAEAANKVGFALWHMAQGECSDLGNMPVFEPSRNLRLEWDRPPGAPQHAIRWTLIDDGALMEGATAWSAE